GARGDREHLAYALDRGGDGLPGAAGRLDGERLEVIALDQAVLVLEALDLERLAAEADHDRGAEVRVGGVAPLRPLQDVVALTLRGHAAAGAVHEGDGPVDLRIVVEQARTIDLIGDELRH